MANRHTDGYTYVYSDTYGHADSHTHADIHTHDHADSHIYARRVRVMLEVVHLFQLRNFLISLAQVEAKWIKGVVNRPTICPWARLCRNSSLSLKAGIST